MSNYVELSIEVLPKTEGSDILIAQLAELQFESFVETDKGFLAYIQEAEFDEEALNALIAAFKSILSVNYAVKIIPQQNWNETWERNFEPIDLQGKCYIRAPFHEKKENYRFDVVIEPKMSFGTGHHDTTQLMLQRLMEMELKDKSLLDMGCGTGILAIVAGMMGATPITAIDIDEWSYENTLENLSRNNISGVTVYKGNSEHLEGKFFSVILANINKNVLLTDLPMYCRSLEKNGDILLSGFFETDIPELKSRATALGLKFEGTGQHNQWAMLHFTKPD